MRSEPRNSPFSRCLRLRSRSVLRSLPRNSSKSKAKIAAGVLFAPYSTYHRRRSVSKSDLPCGSSTTSWPSITISGNSSSASDPGSSDSFRLTTVPCVVAGNSCLMLCRGHVADSGCRVGQRTDGTAAPFPEFWDLFKRGVHDEAFQGASRGWTSCFLVPEIFHVRTFVVVSRRFILLLDWRDH